MKSEKIMTLKCKDWKNENKCTVNAREYHTWAVDSLGNFVADLGCDEATTSDGEYCCAECGSYEVAA